MDPDQALALEQFAAGQRYLRGLFSGGTLAYEALLLLQDYLPAVYSNVPLKTEYRLANSLVSQEHTIVDLGEDEFTVGRLHPMMDNDLRIRRLQQEAVDPQVAVILLDVVLGYGAHPDPAGELAPAIAQARNTAQEAGRFLEVVAVVVGTDEDPQDLHAQMQQLVQAGAHVETSNDAAVRYVGHLLQALTPTTAPASTEMPLPVDLSMLHSPSPRSTSGWSRLPKAWRPRMQRCSRWTGGPRPAATSSLMAILERMRG